MNILMIVDPQVDFITGSLAIEGAKEAMDYLANDIQYMKFDKVIITLDWHPNDYSFFKEWPSHCIKGTKGAMIYPPLADSINNMACNSKVVVLPKGMYKEEYTVAPSRVITIIPNDSHIYICGLAGDVCVLNTINMLLDYITPDITVLSEYTACIDTDVLSKFINETGINYV